jgi:hypothetical protein
MLKLKIYDKNPKKQLHLVIPKKQLNLKGREVDCIKIKNYELVFKKKKK